MLSIPQFLRKIKKNYICSSKYILFVPMHWLLTVNKSEIKCVIPSFIFVISGVTCHICTHLYAYQLQPGFVTLCVLLASLHNGQQLPLVWSPTKKIWANVHWTFQVFLFSFVKNFVTPKDWVATIPYVINCWDGNRKIVEIFTWILVTLHDTRYPIVSLVALGWSRG